MKRVILFLFAVALALYACVVFAQPSPVPFPVAPAAAPASMGFMAWMQAHWALVPVVVLPLYNLFFSALAQAFTILQAKEPQVLQTMGDVGLKVTQWLSANTPTPPKE